jgi:peptidyl-prolyl cis-trans isomerase SurA
MLRQQDYLRSKIYKLLITFMCIFPLGGSAGHVYANPQLYDRIVATVNGQPILHTEIQDKIKVGPIVLVSDFPAKEKASDYERAINDAINIQLIRSFAEELEIEVPDSQINEHINALMKERGLVEQQLRQMLAEQNKPYEEYREDLRLQFLIRRFQGRVILPQIKITEKDVETYYLKKLGSTNQVIELELRQLVVFVDDNTPEEIKSSKQALVAEVHQKLKGGLDFIEAVKLYSDEKDARDRAGLMAPIKLANLAPVLQKALSELNKGEYTSPVQTPAGFHIFFVENKILSGGRDFQEKKDALEQELRMVEIVNTMNKWLEQQHQKSKIEVLSD